MNDEDWQELLTAMKKEPFFNMAAMERDIDIGIKNGHSLERQLDLCRLLLRKLKMEDERR